jgi:hypothetical protein
MAEHHRRARRSDDESAAEEAERASGAAGHPLLALQRAVGNRAVSQLVQRDDERGLARWGSKPNKSAARPAPAAGSHRAAAAAAAAPPAPDPAPPQSDNWTSFDQVHVERAMLSATLKHQDGSREPVDIHVTDGFMWQHPLGVENDTWSRMKRD